MRWRSARGIKADLPGSAGRLALAVGRAIMGVVGWLFAVITALGVVSEDPEVRRRQGFVNIGAVLAGINSFQHLVEQALRNFEALAPLVYHNAIFGVLHLMTPLFHRVSENAAAVWLCAVIILGTAHVIWLTGLDGGAHVYFAFTAGAFLFFGVKNWGHYLVVVLAVLTVVIGALAIVPDRGPIALAAPGFTEQMAAMVVVNVILINVLLFTYALVQTYRAENALAAEVHRADTLLLAILPRPIAQKLKHEPKSLIADRHEAVTIFFADIVGFTKSAQTVAPEVLVAWLDTLIKSIDDLAATHKVEKIKTIGDAYMAASGMRVAPEVGASRLAHFALDFRDLARAYGDLEGNPLGVRVGLH
ncbi:MAG: adenylate/guanylate cyclase domain-containing protein, partial [Pseudomonadota bacterium]